MENAIARVDFSGSSTNVQLVASIKVSMESSASVSLATLEIFMENAYDLTSNLTAITTNDTTNN